MSPFWRDLIGEEAGEPPGGEGSGEGDAQGTSGAFGGDDSFREERGDDSAGLALAGAEDRVGVATGELSAIKEGFQQGAGLCGEFAEARFLFGPE